MAVHPDATRIAYVCEEGVVLADSTSRVIAKNHLPPGDPLAYCLLFDPSGTWLFVGSPSPDPERSEPFELHQFSADSLKEISSVPIAGTPESSLLATWLPEAHLLQLEVNAGPNGYLAHFLGEADGHFQKALNSFDAGEGYFLKLLEDQKSLVQVTSAKALVVNLESGSQESELYFPPPQRADLRPGTNGDFLVVPIHESGRNELWELLILDFSLSERGRIQLPNVGGYASAWCSGPVVFAEQRLHGTSQFFGWQIL